MGTYKLCPKCHTVHKTREHKCSICGAHLIEIDEKTYYTIKKTNIRKARQVAENAAKILGAPPMKKNLEVHPIDGGSIRYTTNPASIVMIILGWKKHGRHLDELLDLAQNSPVPVRITIGAEDEEDVYELDKLVFRGFRKYTVMGSVAYTYMHYPRKNRFILAEDNTR